jgi:molecular chaperone DnaK
LKLKTNLKLFVIRQKKQLEQLESTITSEEKQKIESLVSELEEANKKDDYTGIKDIMENLKKAVMEVGEKAYKEAGVNTPSGDDVIETDFSSEK